MSTPTVRTRFAPSPTGYLHMGGARTALFNYLLARRYGGQFILRIEDTDQARNIPGAQAKLLDDLRWLGLQWDEGPEVGGPCGPYHQSGRLERYQAAAQQLIAAGRAYYAFDTREELDRLRADAQAERRNFRYPRPAVFPSPDEVERARAAGRPVVVRLAMPGHGFTIRDQILGDVEVAASDLDDFVLLKSDGWPTYHFAVVVDDEHMRITHVLRGQEHLLNTANHLALQEALGYATPAYAHLPIILNLDGSKMSKREKDRAVRAGVAARVKAGADPDALRRIAGVDALLFDAWRAGDVQLESDALARLAAHLQTPLPEVEIRDFRASGYLPHVVLNFIALLGWSPGDGREKLTLDEMAASFSLDRIGKTNARFDRAKLLAFNTDAVAAASPAENLARLKDYLSLNPSSPLVALDDAMLQRLLEINRGFRTFRDIDAKCAVLFIPDSDVVYSTDAVEKHLRHAGGAGLKVLSELKAVLAAHGDWTPSGLEPCLKAFAEARGLGLGKVAQPLRVAVTGSTVSPAIFDTLALLGPDRTLRRLERARALAESGAVRAESS